MRGLKNKLKRMKDLPSGWLVFEYAGSQGVTPQNDWYHMWHGTWGYGLWNVLANGVLMESDDTKVGDEFWRVGVYGTPVLETAAWYARPTCLFNDGVYHRMDGV